MAAEPLWKELVETLRKRQFQSPYLERLEQRMKAVRHRKSLEEEILEEMAEALRRAEDKINVALLKLDVLDAEFGELEGVAERAARIEEFNQQWDVARRAIWEFRVHREAIGLHWTRDMDEMFPLPRRKKL